MKGKLPSESLSSLQRKPNSKQPIIHISSQSSAEKVPTKSNASRTSAKPSKEYPSNQPATLFPSIPPNNRLLQGRKISRINPPSKKTLADAGWKASNPKPTPPENQTWRHSMETTITDDTFRLHLQNPRGLKLFRDPLNLQYSLEQFSTTTQEPYAYQNPI
jgi:hypothetical protein